MSVAPAAVGDARSAEAVGARTVGFPWEKAFDGRGIAASTGQAGAWRFPKSGLIEKKARDHVFFSTHARVKSI